MHPVKRRKLDAVRSTLTKPFRSPLRAATHHAAAQGGASDGRELKQNQAAMKISPCQPSSSTASKHAVQRPSSPAAASKSQTADTGNLHVLQREYASLARRLTTLRASLDTAEQALKLETTNQSSDIDALIVKWRSVVRDTADELFEDAKQRMENGGVQSWLKQKGTDSPDRWFGDRHVELTEAQKKMVEAQREDDRAEAEKYGLISKEEVDEETEPTFTMDKMLQQLNIDLRLVGYDKHQQRWVD